MSSSKCFYCEYDIEDQPSHYVSFTSIEAEREEVLCQECYHEWLQGIKG